MALFIDSASLIHSGYKSPSVMSPSVMSLASTIINRQAITESGLMDISDQESLRPESCLQ